LIPEPVTSPLSPSSLGQTINSWGSHEWDVLEQLHYLSNHTKAHLSEHLNDLTLVTAEVVPARPRDARVAGATNQVRGRELVLSFGSEAALAHHQALPRVNRDPLPFRGSGEGPRGEGVGGMKITGVPFFGL
ncbi:MAG: hypothetical protein ACK56I_33750, partial [bacterium]